MRSDLTDITVVMDRSGSMGKIRADAEGGLNTFIDEQKAQAGEALFTLIQFDDDSETVHRGLPIKQVPKCELHPRGNTALLDAVGTAIAQTGDRLRRIPEPDRPGLVVFVVVTDGGENVSQEYDKAEIKRMIDHQESVYKWKFLYLGANQDAFAEGGACGFKAQTISGYNPNRSQETYKLASRKVNTMRHAVSVGDQEELTAGGIFTDAERAEIS